MMIQRDIFNTLIAHRSQPEISMITGPRQAGKTTIMRQMKEQFERNGEKTLFLNYDDESDRPFFASQDALMGKIRLECGGKGGVIFLDEIQRKKNAGLFLKGFYDRGLPYKLIVSGSGSLELKEDIHESLAGRKRLFEVGTISWREFLNWKTQEKYANDLEQWCRLEPAKVRILLDEYMAFGGYPLVVLSDEESEKRKRIEELYRSYIERDILNLLGVEKEESFSRLVRIASAESGMLVNASELGKTVGISLPTAQKYLWYLEKTFVINRVTPFVRNARKEIRKMPVLYFSDLGFRAYADRSFGQIDTGKRGGFIFANFVFLLLKQHVADRGLDVHFWRTKDKAEVDFVLDFSQGPVPIEVKYMKLLRPEIPRSLRSFLTHYHPKQAYIVNLTLDHTDVVKGTVVRWLPYWRLLFGNPHTSLF